MGNCAAKHDDKDFYDLQFDKRPKKNVKNMGLKDDNEHILNSEISDKLFRFFLRKCGGSKKFKKLDSHRQKECQKNILNSMIMFMVNASQKDFSQKHDKFQIDEENKEDPIDPKIMRAKKEKLLEKFTFTKINHPWFIQNEDKSIDIPVNSMDCIRIFDNLKKLKEKTGGDSSLWSPLHLCQFFLVDMTVVMDNKPTQNLILAQGKDYESPKGVTSLKADTSNCDLKAKWPERSGEYAYLWAYTYKGSEGANPSIKEVVMGLIGHHMVIVEATYKDLKENMPERFDLYRNNIRKAFNSLLFTLDMVNYDIDKPITDEIYQDPHHPVTLLILLLYSMEPPIYADLGKACRNLDPEKLQTLGPFAKAIFEVLAHGKYSDQKRKDSIEIGYYFKDTDPLGCMSRSFLLFRGSLMDKEWISAWREKVGQKYIHIPGTTSTSKNMNIALNYSQCDLNYSGNKQHVLFVYSIQNCYGFEGFRLNSQKYSVYPREHEYLLMEGFRVFVLKVQDSFEIKNKNVSLEQFDGKKITVIYLQSYY